MVEAPETAKTEGSGAGNIAPLTRRCHRDGFALKTLLALETSGKSLGVALRSERGLIFHENVTAGSIHGRGLAPLIRKALDQASLRPEQLSAIAVSLGPGSWTGLRIGLSAAKALAWGSGIELVGVPSFEALALDAAAHAPGQARLMLRDARSEGFFLALFDETFDTPVRLIPETVLKPAEMVEEVRQALAQRGAGGVCVSGDRVCLDMIAADAQRNNWTLLSDVEHITGGSVAEAGWRRLLAGESLKSAAEIHKLAPIYLRASGPELKLALKGGQPNQ
jgi:tRNA threonylcarbamoyladenosine biosynthesis protein TsaB